MGDPPRLAAAARRHGTCSLRNRTARLQCPHRVLERRRLRHTSRHLLLLRPDLNRRAAPLLLGGGTLRTPAGTRRFALALADLVRRGARFRTAREIRDALLHPRRDGCGTA